MIQAAYDVIIIGAGQAGLAAAYEAQRRGLTFLVFEASARIGSSWRTRYDSLVLFTPAEYDGLPSFPLDMPHGALPNKDQIADYLERYAAHFAFPVQLEERVRSLSKEGALFRLETESGCYWSERVVIATGAFQRAHVPAYPGSESTTLQQLHSSEYKNAGQLASGPALVVGAGNSAAQIAEELSHSRAVVMSTRQALRFRRLRALGKSVFFWADLLGILHADRDSRRAQRMRRAGDPIFGLSLRTRIAAGAVQVVPEIASICADMVTFVDGSAQRFASIVWATGFRSAYPWLHVEGALDENGQPLHERGLSPVSGLGFLGLPWQRARSSALLMGAGRDAAWLAQQFWPRGTAVRTEGAQTRARDVAQAPTHNVASVSRQRSSHACLASYSKRKLPSSRRKQSLMCGLLAFDPLPKRSLVVPAPYFAAIKSRAPGCSTISSTWPLRCRFSMTT